MQLVRQNEKNTHERRFRSTTCAAVLLLIGVVGGACAQPPDRTAPLPGPDPGPGRSAPGAGPAAAHGPQAAAHGPEAASRGTGHPGPPPSADRRPVPRTAGRPAPAAAPGLPRDLAIYAESRLNARSVRLRAAQRWGLLRPPVAAPAPPVRKARPATPRSLSMGSGLPPVFTRVPTSDRVVFLTIDDGGHKDPELLRMLRELDVPVSAFLSDYVVRDDYGYFRKLQRLGVSLHNHTLTHPDLTELSFEDQYREICRQQRNLEREFGVRPRLFRPPYGNYDRETLLAAKSCGVRSVPLWTQEAFADRIDFADTRGRLHPGDIILTHFRGRGEWGGTMADMVREVLRTATAQGFAVARLEDYI
ncbi:polysaccharide deacetylase family protein [Streptomyces sp. NPDC002055]|uniref:polysaccharide deacetylase family protein n=1 Tax=Streptomyces sp. NPDC002055 TaxID=3154534 RepID=UPI0033175340